MDEQVREIAIHPAPAAMEEYLVKLCKVCGYAEPVQIAQIAGAEMPARVGVTDNPHGFLHLVPGKVPLIVVRDDVPDTRWQNLVAHELLHLIRWTADQWVLTRLASKTEQEIYMHLVEKTMKPLSILLMVGGMVNAEWVEGDNKDGANDAAPTSNL